MNEFLIYLMKSSVCLGVLYLIYWFFLKKDTFFMANRIYLISSIILSFVLPLFKIPVVYEDPELTYVVVMETITVTAQKVESGILNNLSVYQKLFIVYLTGVSIFSFRFIFQILQLVFLIRKFGVTKMDGLKVVKLDRKYSPFSYFNYVFLNEENLEDKNLKEIIDHEKIHIEQKHSIDLVLLEALTIIQWFNPFIWLYKISLKGIHEYLADEGLLAGGMNKINYQNLLLNQTVGVQINDLTNNFNQSLIKKRFIMMTKKQSKRSAGLKLLLFLPVTALLIMCFTLSYAQIEENVKTTVAKAVKAVEKEDVEVSEKSIVQDTVLLTQDELLTVVEKMPSFPGGTEALINYYFSKIKYPKEARKNKVEGRVIVSFIVEKDGSLSEIKILRGIGSGCDEEALRIVSGMPKWTPGTQGGLIVRVQYNLPMLFTLGKDSPKFVARPKIAVTDDVFSVVATMPMFKGGGEALYKYLVENIKYPEEAQKNGVEGRVYVQFIVEKNGDLTGFKILRGIGSGCDEEAIRVVATMPNWIPGIQRGQAVRVQFNLPIKFILKDNSNKEKDEYDAVDYMRETNGKINMVLLKAEEMPKDGTYDEISQHFKDKKLMGIIQTIAPNDMSPTLTYVKVDKQPEIKGYEYVSDFIKENLKYPDEARKNNVEGVVAVTFLIEKDGSKTDLKVRKSLGSGCDEEALRIAKLMNFASAIHKGKVIRIPYNLLIRFSLD